MLTEGKELREIMNDIGQSMNKIITEGYVFNEELDDIKSDNESLGKPNTDLPNKINSVSNNGDIDSQIKEIRKIALNIISKITPMDEPEAYKLVKSVWDSCDKFLTKDTVDTKKIQNQNNIN